MEPVTASTTATAKPTLRVAAFCGSLRKDSWHRGLIRAAEELCEESIPGLRIDHVDISGLPMNALDWASRGRRNCWADRAAAIVSAGGDFGGGRGSFHLRQIGVFLDLHFINKPELHIRAFADPPKFDDEGNLIDGETRERFKKVLLCSRPSRSGSNNTRKTD
ncbi:hypothetical protein ZWY2020_047892 [Hordeum vulgare]|nr:hypothetical protein ZWY2020_047892 [Hordeum vulgare]